MRIAIQAADLDASRIDGTMVYIFNLLKYFGNILPDDEFFIYHKKKFNPKLVPPEFPNYRLKKMRFPFFWTQTCFAREIWKDKPEVLWMPMHDVPFLRRREMKVVATIHDLAFKYFPQYFPKKDLLKLNFLLDRTVKQADKLIAVSESTKKDLLKFYPQINEKNIRVIYHGFDGKIFKKEISDEEMETVLKKNRLRSKSYILFVGAIQPRKNLEILIDAFDLVKKNYPELKLAIAGEKAWMWKNTGERISKSPFRKDIIICEKVSFEELAVLYRQAAVFVFPELYAGFGLPLLEAMASGVPIIAARNSSLPEIGSDAALYFDSGNRWDLAEKINSILDDEELRKKLVEKGRKRIENFSWEKCAKETFNYLTSF